MGPKNQLKIAGNKARMSQFTRCFLNLCRLANTRNDRVRKRNISERGVVMTIHWLALGY